MEESAGKAQQVSALITLQDGRQQPYLINTPISSPFLLLCYDKGYRAMMHVSGYIQDQGKSCIYFIFFLYIHLPIYVLGDSMSTHWEKSMAS